MEDLRIKAREGGGAKVLEKWKSKGKGKLGVRERCVLGSRASCWPLIPVSTPC